MPDLDLKPIMARYSKALDAKPGKGPITEKGIVAITDSVCDVPELLAEVERLERWKSEALPVMDGLQELGRALKLPLGARITGPMALAEVERLRSEVTQFTSANSTRPAVAPTPGLCERCGGRSAEGV